MEDYTADKSNVQVDKQLALAYQKAFREISFLIGCNSNESQELLYVLKTPDVVTQKEQQLDAEELWSKLDQALNIAITNLIMMRKAEGNNIYQDLLNRINLLRNLLTKIEAIRN